MRPEESPVERRARLFSELCELGETERWEALARLAAEDATLAADVERMLAFDRESHGPIEGLRDEVAGAAERQLLAAEAVEPPPPERLGAWRLGEKLGAGGMGEVWAADRVEGGFTQRAAVKLVRSGMASREIVARFAIERQLLARLDHPAIATLLDGGIAPDGRPWFAMERVDGLPITHFANRHALDLEARLRLLLAVADAVDFAHRSLVIHRDLKPSNILVTPSGAPKLLDFGLAKLLEPGFEAGIDPNATRTEFRALTPAYAAPEQILGEAVTTATDVYSLGVILYELLTGELPHRRRLSSATTLATELEHETLERPSQRLRRLEAASSGGMARSRRISADLDTIVLKALARDRVRRYPSISAFAADLVAYLERRPIAARPDTVSYRLARFVRRHRLAVGAAGLVLAALLAALAISLRETRRANAAAAEARLEARRAERVKGFLASVFEQADPLHARGAEISAKQILADGARRLEGELRDEPEVRAELYDLISRIQTRLGLMDEALASGERAASERARLYGKTSVQRAASLTTVGNALFGQGKLEDAAARYAESVATFEAAGDRSSVEYARALSARAQTMMLQGDLPGAAREERRAYELALAARGEDDAETLEHLSNVGVLETEMGTFAEAARIFRGILPKLVAADGEDSSKVLDVVLNLATALDAAGETAEAMPLFERVVAGRRKIFGAGHPALADALVITSLRLSRAGRQEEALAALAEARATYVPIDHPELGSVDNYTGLVLMDMARFAEAEQAFARARKRFLADHGAAHILSATALSNGAAAMSELGRFGEAESMFESAVATLRALEDFDSPRLLRARFAWGANLRKLGRFIEARQVDEAAMELARQKLDAGHLRFADGETELARLDLAEGGEGAAASAAERLARAEAIAAGKPPNPSLARNLAAARVELAAIAARR